MTLPTILLTIIALGNICALQLCHINKEDDNV